MRRYLAVLGLVLSATLLAAQQPARTSGLDPANFDRNTRPQDDFYRYVNGGWLDQTSIPFDKAGYGAFTELSDRSDADVRAIIEDAAGAANRADGSPAQQVGDLYASFMNDTRAEQVGVWPINAELQKIDAIATTQEFAKETGALSAINAAGLVNAAIEADAKDPATPIVYLFQGGTALPDRDYYLQDDPKFVNIRKKYVEYLEKIYTLAGRPDASADAQAVLGLETELARVQWTRVESRDALKTYNKLSWADLATEMPGFDWMAWATPQGLDKSPRVIVSQPSFFTAMAAQVPKTPLRTWKAWLAAQYLTASAPYLNKAFVDANFQFFGATLSGQPNQRDRWKRGVDLVNGRLGMAVGRLYVAKTFSPAAKTRMQTLVHNLLEAYRQSIASLDWMTADTRKQALEKLAKFNTKIGYPDQWKEYKGLVIKRDDLLGNVQRAERFNNDYEVARLGKPVDRTRWLMTPQTVNAYYEPLMNEIVFPAAILKPPFFDVAADEAVNYGAIGAFIGHEIGHGFDDQGRHYDGTGALRDWWTEADAKEFEKRGKMLVEQYNAAEVLPGLHVNGALTLGENIGDLGGVSIAYKAYKISLAGKPSPKLDGQTGEQRFFAGWAQAWRFKFRDEETRRRILIDPHAPAKFRVTIPLSNIQGFYDAFNVQPTDKMYRDPKDRVRIW